MGAVCKECRHFQEERQFSPPLCTHPNAMTMDRVRGPLYPRLDDEFPFKEIKSRDTTDRCDAEGWFEKLNPKPWWLR